MNVGDYLNEKKVEEEIVRVAQLEFPIKKISLNIDENLERRIRYISGELELKRSEFMRDLLEMAMGEFEKHLGLDPMDFDTPYASYVHAGVEEFKIGPFTFTKEEFGRMLKKSRESQVIKTDE